MWATMWSNRTLACAGAALLALAGCGPDLGECDRTLLGGSDGMNMPAAPYMGQVLVHNTCAGGRCHSATAKGDLRVGAPAGLNFDVVPLFDSAAELAKITDGAEVIYDHREVMWSMIEDGSMPPAPPAGLVPLKSEDKEKIRNWLACGAPVIAAPVASPPPGSDWTSIYTALQGKQCATCHAGDGAGGGGFPFGTVDACSAYRRVYEVDAVGPGACAGQGKLVVPSTPDASILLRKLEGEPVCGDPMPGGTALGPSDPTVINLRAWIAAGAKAPECM